jgi:hypothetical protein
MNKVEYARTWRAKNRERIRQYDRAWRAEHPEYFRDWRARHPGYMSAAVRKWVNENRDAYRAFRRKWSKTDKGRALLAARMRRRVAKLHDTYIRHILLAGPLLPAQAIPQELINLKRTMLIIKRHMKLYGTKNTQESG